MRILRHTSGLDADARGAVVAIGNFDGVHRGHQALVGQTRDIAHSEGAPLGVLTFEPHPRSFFRPEGAPFRLTPLRTKSLHLAALGLDLLYVQHFDAAFAAIEAERFVADVLVQGLAARHVVVGYDFCFGRQRKGDVGLLERLGRAHGFGVTALDPVRDTSAEIYSSSLIRDYLANGQPGRAAGLLGHLWEIDGRVLDGDKRGRTIGFPTANLDLDDYLRPAFGVYAVRAGIVEGDATTWHDAVANVGRRPTVDGTTLLLEVHLFDFTGDLYGRHLRIALTDFLRPEQKFDGLDALKTQIAQDCRQARELLEARPLHAGEVAGAPHEG